ncbi:MAG: hypothetical protein R2788_26300 [Saprospiraceae bacterium]
MPALIASRCLASHNQSADVVLFHVLAHVDTDDRILGIEQGSAKALASSVYLPLLDKENKRPNRLVSSCIPARSCGAPHRKRLLPLGPDQ